MRSLSQLLPAWACAALQQGRASLLNLWHPLRLLVRAVLPLAALSLVGLALVQAFYLRNPSRTDTIRKFNVDNLMVMEQVQRAATLPAADIAFIGDSSCLMGIRPISIQRTLALAKVQSLCTIGFVGPAGNAHILTGMIERNAAPKVLVYMIHPVAFRLGKGWEIWPEFVKSVGKVEAPALSFPYSALDYIRFEWLSPVIYSPLPEKFGLYYGSEATFRSSIRERQGSAIDPSIGLNVTSLEALRPAPTPPSGPPTDFDWNEPFAEGLKMLGETIKTLPPQTRVYLVISPVADFTLPPEAELQRTKRAKQIAALLGIGEDRILATPAAMPVAYFAGFAHLNRWGQIVFTEALSKVLAAKLVESGDPAMDRSRE